MRAVLGFVFCILFQTSISYGQCSFYQPRQLENGALSDLDLYSAFAVDSAGRVYNAQTYSGTVDLGQGFTVSGLGSFICGYENGDPFWIKKIGGNNVVCDIQVDESGNIFVSGGFKGALTVDQTTVAGVLLNMQTFVMKFDSNQVLQWIRISGGNNSAQADIDNDFAEHITPDENGGCFVTIHYKQRFEIGSYTVSASASSITKNAVVLHYDLAGNITWLRRVYEVDGATMAPQITSDKQGGAYMVCTVIGNLRLDSIVFPGIPDWSSFAVHISGAGQYDWATPVNYSTESNALYCNDSGELYFGGIFRDTITAGSLSAYAVNRQAVYIAKVNLSGNVLSLDVPVTSMTPNGIIHLSDDGLDVMANGSMYISGYLEAPADFQGIIRSDTAGDIFVARYDNAMNCMWARTLGGPGIVYSDYYPDGVRATSCNSCIVSGGFYGDFRVVPFQFNAQLVNFDFYVFELFAGNGAIWNSGVLVPEMQKTSSVLVYPNPAAEVIMFSSKTHEIQEVKIYNVTGDLIYAGYNPSNTTVSIELSGLPSGIYMYNLLFSTGEINTGKFIHGL
ncbi:MAG: T9SS type A sorting domain-containing protein [Bacteroidia bacterium]|nr:T9SS type A sorting domain-containing protein [Bacteroidia bacterium]